MPDSARIGYPKSPVMHADRDSVSSRSKRPRSRKASTTSRTLDIPGSLYKRKTMDFTDFAYREAVTRLKYLLADSYNFTKGGHQRRGLRNIEDSGEDTDSQGILERPVLSEIYKFVPSSTVPLLSKYGSVRSLQPPQIITATPQGSQMGDAQPPPPELMNFIEKQETYIEQLERESQFCRHELSTLLSKVKDVISENETLTDQAKSGLTKSVFQTIDSSESDDIEMPKALQKYKKPNLEGPNILFESRISELEAKLAQSHIDYQRINEENEVNKRRLTLGGVSDLGGDPYKKQIENLHRDKSTLEDTVRKLQIQINSLKESDATNFSKSQRTRELSEQFSFEKAQSDLEIRRLKEELERQHERFREIQHEMARRIAEERSIAERRYNYQVDQLGGDLTNQWEQSSKLQLELERQRRVESDFKRDLTQKNNQIDELKSEIKNKASCYLTDMAQMNAEKQSLEQEITGLRLQLERAERQTKVETARLNAEINSLRQRLDRSDADLLHSRRENLRLSDQVAELEREITMGEISKEPRPKEMAKIIEDMETKHATTVSELENMIHDQRQLMEKLTTECKNLTFKLEETSLKHKKDFGALQSNVEYLTDRIINTGTTNNTTLNTDNLNNANDNLYSTSNNYENEVSGGQNSAGDEIKHEESTPNKYNVHDQQSTYVDEPYQQQQSSTRPYRSEKSPPTQSSPTFAGSGKEQVEYKRESPSAASDKYTKERTSPTGSTGNKYRTLSRESTKQTLQSGGSRSQSRQRDYDEMPSTGRRNEDGVAPVESSYDGLSRYGGEAAPMVDNYESQQGATVPHYDPQQQQSQNYAPSEYDAQQYDQQQYDPGQTAVYDDQQYQQSAQYAAGQEYDQQYYQPQPEQPNYDAAQYGGYDAYAGSNQQPVVEPKYADPPVAPAAQYPVAGNGDGGRVSSGGTAPRPGSGRSEQVRFAKTSPSPTTPNKPAPQQR